jgi:hypothetical protein
MPSGALGCGPASLPSDTPGLAVQLPAWRGSGSFPEVELRSWLCPRCLCGMGLGGVRTVCWPLPHLWGLPESLTVCLFLLSMSHSLFLLLSCLWFFVGFFPLLQ